MPTREEMHSLGQGIASSYEARVVDIASIREVAQLVCEATQAELRELYTARQAIAHRQRADLAKGRADLREAEAKRKPEVSAWIKDVARGHQAMAQQQRAVLAKGRADVAQGEVRRKSGVNAWMKDVATAHAAVHDEWQELAAAMRAKRGVPVAEGKAVAEVHPDFVALRQRAFAYLADRPDGTRMTELEKEFGIARIKMARVIKNLMDEGKVKKQDLLYFAI